MEARQFAPRSQWLVVREGARLEGMELDRSSTSGGSAYRTVRIELRVDDVLECAGMHELVFSDGVSALTWRDPREGGRASSITFRPYSGGMWGGMPPENGYLLSLEGWGRRSEDRWVYSERDADGQGLQVDLVRNDDVWTWGLSAWAGSLGSDVLDGEPAIRLADAMQESVAALRKWAEPCAPDVEDHTACTNPSCSVPDEPPMSSEADCLVLVTDPDGRQWVLAPDGDVALSRDRAATLVDQLNAAGHSAGLDHADVVEWFLPGPEIDDVLEADASATPPGRSDL